jgi:HEPN domain-containing protein
MAVTRVYSVTDGVTVADLLHFGLDHISAAQALLKTNARHFDSAGYLAHLRLELLLKAWHLHTFNKFPGIHSLDKLWQGLLPSSHVRPLSRRDSATLCLFDGYFGLRYPELKKPREVGSDDLPRISLLLHALFKRMPKSLHEIVAGLRWSTKGDRILMEKPETPETKVGISPKPSPS